MTRSAGMRVLCEDPSCMRAATHQVALVADGTTTPERAIVGCCCEAHAHEAVADQDYAKALFEVVLFRVRAQRGDAGAIYEELAKSLEEESRENLERFRVALAELDS